jgi:hypothetical protein
MNIENIYTIAATSGGGFFASFLIRYFIRGIINTILTNATVIFSNDDNPGSLQSNLAIPVSGSVTAGFVLGVTRGG